MKIAVSAHQAKQQEIRGSAGNLWTERGVIFATNTGGYSSLALLRRRLHRLLLEAGLLPCRVHAIRNSTVQVLCALGVDPHIIRALLGFRQVTITTLLAPISPAMGEDAIQCLMNYLSEEIR